MFGSSSKVKPRPSLYFETLEPRVLLSADPLSAAIAGLLPPDQPSNDFAPDRSALKSDLVNEIETTPALTSENILEGLAPAESPTAGSVLFIDGSLNDVETLIADFSASIDDLQVVILDANQDGVEQISSYLAEQQNLEQIHLVSHGDSTGVQLGSLKLDSTTLATRSVEIETWRSALSADADLFIYGCDLAATEQGRALVDDLALLTAADVAASDDLTGSTTAGADWDLEYRVGAIDTAGVSAALSSAAWQHTLALYAYEGFDYPAAAEGLNNQGGGFGFINAWDDEGDDAATVATSQSDPTGQLATSGGALQVTTGFLQTFDYTRQMAVELGADGTEAWFSFVVQVDGDNNIDGTTFKFGAPGNQVIAGFIGNSLTIADSNGSNRVDAATAAIDGDNYFLTVRAQFAAGNDTLSLYVNPTPGLPTPDVAPEAVKTDVDLGLFRNVGVAAGFSTNDGFFDELRVGETFADVAPQATALGTAKLNISTDNNVSAGGQPGVENWSQADLVTIGDPNLDLGPGTTDGTFSIGIDVDAFAPNADLISAHVVSNDTPIGTSGFVAKVGDVLFSAKGGTNTYTSTNAGPLDTGFATSVTADDEDLIVFRPDTPGDYSRGQFGMLIEDVVGGHQLRGISLVEQDVNVGGTELRQGDFIYSRSGGNDDSDVHWYQTNTTGTGATPNDRIKLITGGDSDVAISQQIRGLELIEQTLSVGGETLTAGTVLVSLNNDDSIGKNGQTVDEYDVAALTVNQSTEHAGNGNGDVTARLLFDGSQVAFDNGGEKIRAVALSGASFVSDNDPVFTSSGPFPVDENTAVGITVGDIDANDGDGGAADAGISYAITGNVDPDGDNNNAFAIDPSTGVITVNDADDLDHETNDLLSIFVQATDGLRITGTTVDISVTNINEGNGGAVAIDNTTPTQGDTLTASNTLTDPDGLSGPISYQWQRGGVDIVGATGSTYVTTQADVNQAIRVVASYTDDGGFMESVPSVATANVNNVNDAPTGTVSIDNTTPNQGDTLTASNTLTDPDGISGAISYQWQRGGVDIAGATGATYVTTQADVNQAIRVVASYTDDEGANESRASAETAGVANVNDAPGGTLTIDNLTPTQGDTLTATDAITDDDGISGGRSYQWLRDGADISSATGLSYTLTQADVGAKISLRLTYTDDFTANESVTSGETIAVTNQNDAPAGAITIDNLAPTQGDTLTATDAVTDLDGVSGARSYQWLRDGVAIGGETGLTYTLAGADVGAAISIRLNYTDDFTNPESVTSVATAAVNPPANTPPSGTVSIDNTAPNQGDTLTASNTLTDPDGISGPISYQWQRGGVDITGATGATYVTTQADVNQAIRVVASYTDDIGNNESKASAATAGVVDVNDPPGGAVAIDNTTPDQGDTLTASNTLTDADGLSGAISYQWQRGSVNIAGATGATYVTTQDDVNQTIRVVASFTDDAGNPESVASAATAGVNNVNDAPGGAVTIDNTAPDQGDTLTASNTLTDPDGLSGPISYQWQRGGVDIAGATGATYVTTQADVNQAIRVVASFTDDDGAPESVASAATAGVNNVNDAPGGTVTIDNTAPDQGDTLTASNTLTDPDGLSGAISYQWKRNGVDITGATGTTYVTTQADVNQTIRVVASYTDDAGNNESMASSPTSSVDNVNDAATGTPSLMGVVEEDQTLSATPGTISDPDGLGTFNYQWLRNGAAITGATNSTYTLDDADVGTRISVAVSFTDAFGGTEGPLTSAETAFVSNINDAPTVTTNQLTLNAGDRVTLTVGSNIAATDPDHAASAFSYNVTGVTAGQFELATNPGVAITSFSHGTLMAGDVVFVHDGSGTAPTYDLTVSDGSDASSPSSATVTFSVPPPPVDENEDLSEAEQIDVFQDAQQQSEVGAGREREANDDAARESDSGNASPGTSATESDNESDDAKIEIKKQLIAEASLTENQLSSSNDSSTDSLESDSARRDNDGSDGRDGPRQRLQAILNGPGVVSADRLIGALPIPFSVALEAMDAVFENGAFARDLDSIRDNVETELVLTKAKVGSTVAVSTGLSVGYVMWLIRGGVLVSSMLSSLPAWRFVDPLPVLSHLSDDEDEDDESLSAMVERGAHENAKEDHTNNDDLGTDK